VPASVQEERLPLGVDRLPYRSAHDEDVVGVISSEECEQIVSLLAECLRPIAVQERELAARR
jgi:hypothetical protein